MHKYYYCYYYYYYLLQIGLYLVAVCYNARQNITIQYSAEQYDTIPHITHNNIQHSRQPSILKITGKKIQEHILYTIKNQTWVEPEVGESVLNITRYTKQWVNHTTQYSITHISPRPTPHSTSLHYPYIHFVSHPALIPFPSPHLADLHPTSITFTSLHLSLSKPCSWKYSISSVIQNPFTSLHLTLS